MYISLVSATQVTMYIYNDGSNYSGQVTLDETDGNPDYANFYHAYNTSLTSAFSFTFDHSDSAHLANGSFVDFTLSRWYE